MNKLRHAVAGLVLFTIMIGSLITFYDNGLVSGYGITPTDYKEINGKNQSIMDQFKDMNLISGINATTRGFLKISPPKGSNIEFDIIGGLLITGIGVVKSFIGLASTPFEFIAILLEYYAEIPHIITELALFVAVYVCFVLLSLYVNREV